MPNNLLLCCGVQPITSIRHVERMRPLQEDQEAYIITCGICGRVAVEIFTDDNWQEAQERAREKWNRSIVEEINAADD